MPVATTEDELNDTPALTRAEVGVAMGANGKEVAKEVTEIVLVDDDLPRLLMRAPSGNP